MTWRLQRTWISRGKRWLSGNNSQRKSNIDGNVAILAPGTGLGEAGLFWDE